MVELNTKLSPHLQTHLIGHQSQWQLLQRKFQDNELHPAWLLSGPKGIGKATFVYQIARHILKAHQNNDQFFDTLISQKSHPNLLIIEKEFNEDGKLENEISIDSIRKIAHFVHQSAAFPGWRIIIIDAVDDLNRNAANALLKILEEPPKQVLILLICHGIGRILPTIRSRCCLLSMTGPTTEELTTLCHDPLSPLTLTLAHNSIGRLVDLQQIDLTCFLDEIIQVLQSVLQNKLLPLQQFVNSFAKGELRAALLLDLLSWISCQLVLIQSNSVVGFVPSLQMNQLSALRPTPHWLLVQEQLSSLIYQAEETHLDLPTLYTAAFLCFESPQLLQT